MSLDRWNVKFTENEGVSDIQPNSFFKNKIDEIYPGKILLPLEGEGRNAVYAASKGWDVVVFDEKESDKKKALKLAELNGVTIDYSLKRCDEADYEDCTFDCIALLYTHMSKQNRVDTFSRMISYLKPGGIIILEGFNHENNELIDVIGSKKESWFFSIDDLQEDFEKFKRIDLSKSKVKCIDGDRMIVRLFGKK